VGFNGYPHGDYTSTEFLYPTVQSSSLGLVLDTQLDVQTPTILRGVE
jgi:hypothetical protein